MAYVSIASLNLSMLTRDRWIDADLILVNPSVPLESFLPPTDLVESIHFLGGRDHNGLNTGTFFLRVSAWSVHMLNKAIGLAFYHPEIELGNSFDQVAMSHVLTNDYGFDEKAQEWEHPNETISAKAKRLSVVTRPFLFQPREWYNTYEFKHGYEGGSATAGHLLVHFPGLEQDRWALMDAWLDRISHDAAVWDIPFANTVYASEVPKYWQLVREARALVKSANETLADMVPHSREYAQLRQHVDLCESPITNASYSIGPGQDLLRHMHGGISSLRHFLQTDLREGPAEAYDETGTNSHGGTNQRQPES